MAKKKLRKQVDSELLDGIIAVEKEWKFARKLSGQSIAPNEFGQFKENIAKAKYAYLLHEARRRDVSIIRYD